MNAVLHDRSTWLGNILPDTGRCKMEEEKHKKYSSSSSRYFLVIFAVISVR